MKQRDPDPIGDFLLRVFLWLLVKGLYLISWMHSEIERIDALCEEEIYQEAVSSIKARIRQAWYWITGRR